MKKTIEELLTSVIFLCDSGLMDTNLMIDVYKSTWENGEFKITDFVAEWDGLEEFQKDVTEWNLGNMIYSDIEMMGNAFTGMIDYLTIYLPQR